MFTGCGQVQVACSGRELQGLRLASRLQMRTIVRSPPSSKRTYFVRIELFNKKKVNSCARKINGDAMNEDLIEASVETKQYWKPTLQDGMAL